MSALRNPPAFGVAIILLASCAWGEPEIDRLRVPEGFAGFHEEGPPIREAVEAVERLNTDQVLRAGLPATIWWRDTQTEETTFRDS